MAARGNGVYRGDKRFELEVSSRRVVKNGRVENYVRDTRHERVRVRQVEVKGRDVANGQHMLSSGVSDLGSSAGDDKNGLLSTSNIDREPGELSSESGSDDPIDSEAPIKDVNVPRPEGDIPLALEKKRKFSPIVWDRDDKDTLKASKSRGSPRAIGLPPPPPLPKAYSKSPNPNGVVRISPIQTSKLQASVQSPSEPSLVDVENNASHESDALVGWGSHMVAEQVEEDDFVPTRNISSSRWADDATSPRDEGEISDDGIHKRRRKMPPSESLQMRLHRKSISPGLNELKGENSIGAREGLSDSDDRDSRSRPSSKDNYLDHDRDENDLMDSVDGNDYRDISISPAEASSEDDEPHEAELARPPQRSLNMLRGCRSVDEFERLNKIDEGTYGIVYRAKDKGSGEIVALKKVKMEKEKEGFPLTALREINILLSFHHPSIVDVKEVVIGTNLDSIFMVMEYMEHDLKGLMETMKQPYSQSEVKCLMLQLLEGVKYLHDNWVLHRDLKTSNLLLNNRGELKICDFGLARQYGSPLKPYTQVVVTLWYRAPELLLGAKQYSTAIDMWSLGCIMAELLSKAPLFNGKTELEQLDKIFKTLGTPNETIWPGFSKLPGVKVKFGKHQYNLLRKKFPATSFTGSPVLSDAGFDLLNKLLTYDPEKRITVGAALDHEWFREVPLPKAKDFMPTFPAQHAQDRRSRRILKSPDPLEELRRKELQQRESGTGGVFG